MGNRTYNKRKGEMVSIVIGVTLLFILICVLTLFLYKTQYNTEKLALQHSIERFYTNLLIAAQESDGDVIRVMEDEDIIGFGYYSVDGTPIKLWGDTKYSRLPITFFSDTNVPHFKHSNIVGYNEENGIVECIKYYSPGYTNEEMELLPFYELISDETNYIIYLSFRGSDYLEKINLIHLAVIASISVFVLVYVVVMVTVIQNIRYRRKLRSQESLVALGEAARTLTHEIKNPLSAITLQLALLKRTAPEALEEDIQVLKDESNRLVELANKVSEFLRNPLGSPKKIDLIATVLKILPVYGDSIPFNTNGINKAIINFDPDRFRSIIENIIVNAIDASGGSISGIELELSTAARDSQYVLTVRDRGCGIDEKVAKRAFEPFYTTKIKGSGIGLAIANQFVSAAGGTISIGPRDGGGTEVTVSFIKCRDVGV